MEKGAQNLSSDLDELYERIRHSLFSWFSICFVPAAVILIKAILPTYLLHKEL